MEESETFRTSVMPFSWLVGFVGLLGMGLLLVLRIARGHWSDEAFNLFTVLACVPILTLGVRVARGHFRRDLKD